MERPGFDLNAMIESVIAAIKLKRQVIIYKANCVKPAHTYRDQPPLSAREALALIREEQSCMFAIQLRPGEICVDFDGDDAVENRRRFYRDMGLKATHTTKTPSGGYHDIFSVPVDYESITGTDVLRPQYRKVDVLNHRSSPVVWGGSFRHARPGKCAGMYTHIGGVRRFSPATAKVLDLLKRPPVPEVSPAERKPFTGDIHPVSQKVLDEELDKLATCRAGAGQRDKTLWSVTATLHAFASGGEFPISGLEGMLIEAAKVNGSYGEDAKRVKNTIASGKRKGLSKPRSLADYREKYDRKRAANESVGAGDHGKGKRIA